MRFKRLDLNLLVALDALLRERSVSRAAASVNLSQPAMSNALTRLRDYFKDNLLVQVGRRMEMTPLAESLAAPVREILLSIDTAIAVQPEFIPTESKRTFNLLVSEYTTSVLIPTLVAILWNESKTIGLRLLPQKATPEELLTSGDADLLIMPSIFLPAGHPSEPLYDDDYICVVSKDSTAFGDDLSLDEYLTASHIVTEFGSARYSYEGWFMERQGIERHIAISTPSLLAPCQLVIGTDRIATVHSRIAVNAARTLPIRLLPLPLKMPKLEQTMQWHRYRTQDLGLKWLRERLHDAAKMIGAAQSPPR